jgi:hypothetical protein
MCATCVAQGAAYLVPAYAVVQTRRWRRRQRTPDGEGVTSARAVDDRRLQEVDA